MGLAYNPGIGGKLAVMLLLSSLAGCATSEVAKEVALKQQLVQSEQKNNIASLSEVIKANPNDGNALNLRGAAYGQAGDFESALADFNAALAINSQFPQAYGRRRIDRNARIGRRRVHENYDRRIRRRVVVTASRDRAHPTHHHTTKQPRPFHAYTSHR
jgi:tetratricopeptide (TPR) repeat protein